MVVVCTAIVGSSVWENLHLFGCIYLEINVNIKGQGFQYSSLWLVVALQMPAGELSSMFNTKAHVLHIYLDLISGRFSTFASEIFQNYIQCCQEANRRNTSRYQKYQFFLEANFDVLYWFQHQQACLGMSYLLEWKRT